MKKAGLIFTCLLIALGCFAQKEIKPADARDNIGEMVKVCARIVEASFDEPAKGSPTWLYTASDTANSPISFIIWGEKRKNFDYKPEKDLKDREVCVTGKILMVREKPVLIVDRQSQIEIR